MWLLVEVTSAGPVVRAIGPSAREGLRLQAGVEGVLLGDLPSPSPELEQVRGVVTATVADGLRRTLDTPVGPIVVERISGGTSTWVVVHALIDETSIDRFFQRAPLGAFVSTVSGLVRFCNDSYAGYLARKPTQIVGRHNRELFGQALAERFEARNQQVVRSGQTAESVEMFETPAGPRTFFINLFPLPSSAPGAEPEVAGVLMDVTDRLVAQQALARQELTMNTVLEKVNNGVWVVDADWKTTFVNPAMASMLGRSPQQLLGMRPDELVRRSEVDDVATRMRDRERGDSINASETVFLKPDGAEVFTIHSATPLLDADRKFAGSVAVVMDITDQKRREQELRRADERLREAQKLESLGVLAGGIAHDFNNLLTGILGNTGSLRDELRRAPEAVESVALIEKAATRAAELCRQMLAFSGRGHFVVKLIDLSAHIASSIELARASVDKRHVLNLELAPDLPHVKADTSQLSQVLLSLILNASEAIGPKPGVVRIATSVVDADARYLQSTYLAPDLPAGRYVCLDVTDDGEGMTPEVQTRLFEPYFSTRATGRGLGLPAALGVLRGHRGAVKVTSTPGKGSTVRVLLPAIEARTSSSTAMPAVAASAGAGRVVLVVDDEPLVRSTLRRLLVRDGYSVVEAGDGQHALDLLAQMERPDVVLLDLSMPKLDGAATFRELQKLDASLPVVLMSGYSEQDAVQHFLGEDLAGFVQQPFSNAEVLRCLSQALGKRLATSA
ncbi:MAG: PAS domain-containing protein [Archangiaceae bacterium]|nr:PAS domain-containing protein [Archangiaceae bacterium]